MPFVPTLDLQAIPNVGILGRNARYTKNNLSPATFPFIVNTLNTVDAPSFVGLDFSVFNNNAATTAVILLDGEEIDVVGGGTESISDTPYNEVKITAGANLYLRLAGITRAFWEQLANHPFATNVETWN